MKRMRKIGIFHWQEQGGLIGVQTAIAVVAFIIVAFIAAQCGFALFTASQFNPGTAKEISLPGLKENANTLVQKGTVIAEESVWTADRIANIHFKLTNSAGADPASLAPSTTRVVYSDANNQKDAFYTGSIATTADLPVAGDSVGWGHRWILGGGDSVNPGEVVEFILNLQRLETHPLVANTPFKIELIMGESGVLTIERTTPSEIKPIMDLD